jgi:hypothetical protein
LFEGRCYFYSDRLAVIVNRMGTQIDTGPQMKRERGHLVFRQLNDLEKVRLSSSMNDARRSLGIAEIQ